MGVEAAAKPPGDWWWSGPQVQISVIVAITQQSFLRIEAGNGFVTTEFGHELVGPKLLTASALSGQWSVLWDRPDVGKRQEGENSLTFLWSSAGNGTKKYGLSLL
jgi:hypothetical protein